MKALKILLYLLVIFTFILTGFLFSQFTSKIIYEREIANLTRVIDGDTIETDLEKVRLLGINSPEKNEIGYEEARLYLKQFEGKEVELIRGKENKDRYERLLRYLFYDNKLINEEILSLGLAHLYFYKEDEYTSRLKKAESQARKKELGIWQKSKDICSNCISLEELNYVDPGEYVLLENSCNFSCNLKAWTIKDDATHIKILDFSLASKEKRKIDYQGRIWNDDGDSFYLRDEKGFLVLFYRY